MDAAEILTIANRTFLIMLVVMDPVGLAPIFLALAGSRPEFERRKIVKKAIITAGCIILVFGLFGKAILEHLGISLGAFRVAGGILLFLIALDMVFARSNGAKESPAEEKEAQDREDISVFPLAIPLIAGPGTLASIMIQTNSAHGEPVLISVVFAVTALVLLLCYAALRLSGRIAKLIGITGIHVVTRVLGVMLGALAIQYMADGLMDLIKRGLG